MNVDIDPAILYIQIVLWLPRRRPHELSDFDATGQSRKSSPRAYQATATAPFLLFQRGQPCALGVLKVIRGVPRGLLNAMDWRRATGRWPGTSRGEMGTEIGGSDSEIAERVAIASGIPRICLCERPHHCMDPPPGDPTFSPLESIVTQLHFAK